MVFPADGAWVYIPSVTLWAELEGQSALLLNWFVLFLFLLETIFAQVVQRCRVSEGVSKWSHAQNCEPKNGLKRSLKKGVSCKRENGPRLQKEQKHLVPLLTYFKFVSSNPSFGQMVLIFEQRWLQVITFCWSKVKVLKREKNILLATSSEWIDRDPNPPSIKQNQLAPQVSCKAAPKYIYIFFLRVVCSAALAKVFFSLTAV